MQVKKALPSLIITAAGILGVSCLGFGQANENCGYENGVTKYCGNGYAWEFGKDSYAIEGNHLFGFAPSDAQWEYVSGGWNGSSCEQNQRGVFIAAPNITIKEAESARYRTLYFSLPITALMTATKFLPADGSPIFTYELQANNKTLIGPTTFTLTDWVFEDSRRFASYSKPLTGSTTIKNEELRNVKVVISNLIQKADPSKDYRCYRFDLVLGKGRIDLLQ